MLEGLYSAAAGMAAQQNRMEAISGDVANVSTPGYKHNRMAFRDLVYTQAGRGSSAGVERGAGAAAELMGRGFAQGVMRTTEEPLDLAVEGEGFFQVQREDGSVGLTRDGAFHLDPGGRLVSNTGGLVVPGVTVPRGIDPSDIQIGADGSVSAGNRRLGQIALVDVRSREGLEATGDGLFNVTAQSGAPRPAAGSRLAQGFLEQSNVDLGDSMIDLMDAQRSFQLASKAIQMQDQMMEIANGVKR